MLLASVGTCIHMSMHTFTIIIIIIITILKVDYVTIIKEVMNLIWRKDRRGVGGGERSIVMAMQCSCMLKLWRNRQSHAFMIYEFKAKHLCSKFQASQGYKERPCLKKQ